jgi:hypothetical protein
MTPIVHSEELALPLFLGLDGADSIRLTPMIGGVQKQS